MNELIKKQKEYIQLLSDELSEVVSMVSVHGWKSTRFEQGKKLREEIAELEANPDKWISVEDRLPKEEDTDENGEVLWRSGHNHRVDLWNINTEICGDTHWMPLPPKPNQP